MPSYVVSTRSLFLFIPVFLVIVHAAPPGAVASEADPPAGVTEQSNIDESVPTDVATYAGHWSLTVQEARRRLDLQRGPLLDDIDARARLLAATTYSATWLEHDGFYAVIALAGDTSEVVARLQEEFADIEIRGLTVDHNAWELESTYRALTALRYDPVFQDITGKHFSVWIDVQRNRVVLGAERESEIQELLSSIRAFQAEQPMDEAATLERFGIQRRIDTGELATPFLRQDLPLLAPPQQVTQQNVFEPTDLEAMVDIEVQGPARDEHQSSCSARSHCYGLRAGLYPYYIQNVGQCTSGFSVTQGSSRGTTTAGHCSPSPFNQMVRHGANDSAHNIGTVSGRWDSGSVDGLWIRIANPPYQTAQIYLSIKVMGLEPYSSTGFNTYLCAHYGRSYSTDGCGYVQTNAASFSNNSYQIAISKAYMQSQPGDSGSPYREGNDAAAVHNGSDGSYVYSTSAQLMMNQLLVNLSTTS